jgi:hypothetical protein
MCDESNIPPRDMIDALKKAKEELDNMYEKVSAR